MTDLARLRERARAIFGPEYRDSVERWVDYWGQSRRRNEEILKAFRRLVLLDFTGKRVLDIGCGTGGLGEVVGPACRLYVGGDYDSGVLRFAVPAPGRVYLQCSGTALPFGDQVFDYIFAFDVIEHLVGGEPWQLDFLKELRRVLRPLGMIFITTPNRWHPYDGHTGLYFPHYLPLSLSDRYIAWQNPGFLREHRSFSAIRLLTPRQLKALLRGSHLSFLHDLPCGLDREEFRRLFPLKGALARVGLGWYPHAEFWGVLVGAEERDRLRLKLRDTWYYEINQPAPEPVSEFGPAVDFRRGTFSHQLGPGWYWHESENGTGFRWTQREAVCYLQASKDQDYVRLDAYTPVANHVEVWADGLRVGELGVESPSPVELEFLNPVPSSGPRIVEVRIRCRRTTRPENPQDRRDLGVMVFNIEIC